MLTAAATGFATGLSLIVAIGAQNAFVLRQGLMNRHVLWVCLTCAVCDGILIGLGVIAADRISDAFAGASNLLIWGGAAFLATYGIVSMVRAFSPRVLKTDTTGNGSLRVAIGTVLVLTWLNPHVYIDTVGLIGAVSTGFPAAGGKVAYWAGATLASFAFFFTLGYGARLLAPVFATPRAWAILDALIALIMWTIAITLIVEF